MEAYSIAILVFVLGLCFGSFINVLVLRLPYGASIIVSSACCSCKHKIAWYDNIPVLSFFILKGHCRNCGAKISWMYPLTELMAASMTLILFFKHGLTGEFFIVTTLFYVLLTLSMIDLKFKAVPDYLLLIALVLVFFVPSLQWFEQLKNAMLFSGAFVLLNFVVTFYIQNIKSKFSDDETLKEQTALGEGDIPIIALIPALLGVMSGFIAIFLAALFAIMPSLYNSIVKKDTQLPFIPFLSLGLFVEYIFSFSKVFS